MSAITGPAKQLCLQRIDSQAARASRCVRNPTPATIIVYGKIAAIAGLTEDSVSQGFDRRLIYTNDSLNEISLPLRSRGTCELVLAYHLQFWRKLAQESYSASSRGLERSQHLLIRLAPAFASKG
jgi:hypothetical protein